MNILPTRRCFSAVLLAVVIFGRPASAAATTRDLSEDLFLPPLLLSVAAAPQAITSPFTYSGTTVGGPTFNRPLVNGNGAPTNLSGLATAVPYDVMQFTVSVDGTYSFLSQSNTTAYDNFTVLYSGSFNPASPLTNALVANDDLTSTTTSGFSRALSPGTTYFFVTTGFDNGDAGAFTDTITLVPEPSTWALLGAGVAGAGVVAMRRRVAP